MLLSRPDGPLLDLDGPDPGADHRDVVNLRRPSGPRPVVKAGAPPSAGSELLPDELLRHSAVVHRQQIALRKLHLDGEPGEALHHADVDDDRLEPATRLRVERHTTATDRGDPGDELSLLEHGDGGLRRRPRRVRRQP